MRIEVHDATPEEAASYARLSPRGLLARALSQASLYTVGGVGVRAAEFLLLPLYWALLPPSQYGILAGAAIVGEFLRAVFGFGLPAAIARFWHDWPAEERARRLGAIWTAAWLGSAALAAALWAGGAALLAPLVRTVPFSPYLELAILSALASSLVQVPLMVLRMMERPVPYVVGTAIQTLLAAGLAIGLVAGRGRGAAGVLEAQAIAGAVVALGYAFALRHAVRPGLDPRLLAGMGAFALPLVPSKLLEALATVADRFVLEKRLPLEALGVYHAARQVGRGVEVVAFGLLTAWIPFQMRVLAERPRDGRAVIGASAAWFVLAVLLTALAVTLLGPPSLRLLGLAGYEAVPPLVPLAVLSAAILGVAHVLIQGYIIARQTRVAWLRSGMRLAVTVVALLWLVPRWGLPGALGALALAAVAQGAVGYGLAQRFFPLPFPRRTLAGLVLGALGLGALALPLARLDALPALGAGAAVLAAYALLAVRGLAAVDARSRAR